MNTFKSFPQILFQIGPNNFETLALEVFQYQAVHNWVYKEYLSHLNVKIENVKSIAEIPFLPISFFKTHTIKCDEWESEAQFMSSGTTGEQRSAHHVKSLEHYRKVSAEIFESVYGPLENFTFLALLPSYLERADSSLIYMVDGFLKRGRPNSGFYLDNLDKLVDAVKNSIKNGYKVVLLGVSFALLELAERYQLDLTDVIVMETGGMKGRRKEMIREDLHRKLERAFNVENIHSEYGMTELLSQAYSKGNGEFYSPPWMKILLRDLNDPFDTTGRSVGGVNVIDLANIHTCCFIETQDMGKVNSNGSFEILGRFDNSEIRGCNLLVATQ